MPARKRAGIFVEFYPDPSPDQDPDPSPYPDPYPSPDPQYPDPSPDPDPYPSPDPQDPDPYPSPDPQDPSPTVLFTLAIYAFQTGTASIDAFAFSLSGRISMTPRRVTSGTAIGNLHPKGLLTPSIESWLSDAAPDQYQRRRALDTTASEPSRDSSTPANTPAD